MGDCGADAGVRLVDTSVDAGARRLGSPEKLSLTAAAAKGQSKHVIVGTAGHIDHGKTELVRALTGIDTDRLAEEKRRGITIDLGFAHLDARPDLTLGLVDVPGHERFVRNMLAGVGGIDLVLLVVAADESIMPQTREHFDICRLLGIQKGLVALTKMDLVDPDLVELVKLETQEFFKGSFLQDAPVVPVSSKTGEGLGELRQALTAVAREVEPKNSRRHLRLPIDRVFVMKGFGTVITGTMVSGSLHAESEVEVYPIEKRVRVRGLQVHNETREIATAGQRTAVNLSGVEAGTLRRGMVLAAPGRFQASRRIDCRLDLLPSARPLKYGAPVHFHTGTAELEGRLYYLDRRAGLRPGDSAYTQARFKEPLLVLPGDRFIVRQFSPVITIGGGVVLDNRPPERRASQEWKARLDALASGDAEKVLEALLRDSAYGVAQSDIVSRTGWIEDELEDAARSLEGQGLAVRIHEDPTWLVHPEPHRIALQRVVDFLEQFHKKNPLMPGVSKEALRSSQFPDAPVFVAEAVFRQLVQQGRIESDGEIVRLAGHRIEFQEDEQEAREKIVSLFRDAALKVPMMRELLPKLPVDPSRARKILQTLLREGVLVKVSEDLVFQRESVERLKSLLKEYRSRSKTISVPVFKDLAGISRKYAIPLLEYLDREKITRRVGDERLIL